MSKLNPRQEKFVAEYLKTLNMTQSAIKAGYSPHTASEQASRLLKNKKVAKYIDEQRKRIIDEGVLSANELLHILSNAAVGDESEVREVVVKRGEFQRNPDTDKMNLVYNEHVEMVEVPIKPSDRLRARDMLGKYHKLFTDKKELAYETPVIVNIGDWPENEEEEKQKAIDELHEQHPNRTMIINDIPDED
ncbi:terminase small subunit [Staphylococcus epidermidis]|uniref:terminase small subunit n=1 Tax=Staphylococcus epidermidis TaxID=1282 RepID=UPI003390A5C1